MVLRHRDNCTLICFRQSPYVSVTNVKILGVTTGLLIDKVLNGFFPLENVYNSVMYWSLTSFRY